MFALCDTDSMTSRTGGCVKRAGCVREGLLAGRRGIGVDLGRNNHGQQREKEVKEEVMLLRAMGGISYIPKSTRARYL